jgi:hypothetical protein
MSERLQAARAELLRLIERYVRPTNLGQQAYVKLSAAMDELHDAAIEAHKVLATCNPAQAFSEGVDGKLLVGSENPTPIEVATPSPGAIIQDGEVLVNGIHDELVVVTPPADVPPSDAADLSIHTDGVERLNVPAGSPASVPPAAVLEVTKTEKPTKGKNK